MPKHLVTTYSSCLSILLLNGLAFAAFADKQSFYCPEKAAFISVGMTTDQVMAACGTPISQEDATKPATQQVPVKQVFFNNQGQSTAFYGVWAIPGGSGNYGEYVPFQANNGGGGVQLEIDIAGDQIKAIKVNDNDTQAMSLCGGVSLKVGDPARMAYNACGTPTLENKTFVNEVIPSKDKPKIWVYKPSEYEPSVTLTFVNGKLLSIQ